MDTNIMCAVKAKCCGVSLEYFNGSYKLPKDEEECDNDLSPNKHKGIIHISSATNISIERSYKGEVDIRFGRNNAIRLLNPSPEDIRTKIKTLLTIA